MGPGSVLRVVLTVISTTNCDPVGTFDPDGTAVENTYPTVPCV